MLSSPMYRYCLPLSIFPVSQKPKIVGKSHLLFEDIWISKIIPSALCLLGGGRRHWVHCLLYLLFALLSLCAGTTTMMDAGSWTDRQPHWGSGGRGSRGELWDCYCQTLVFLPELFFERARWAPNFRICIISDMNQVLLKKWQMIPDFFGGGGSQVKNNTFWRALAQFENQNDYTKI